MAVVLALLTPFQAARRVKEGRRLAETLAADGTFPAFGVLVAGIIGSILAAILQVNTLAF